MNGGITRTECPLYGTRYCDLLNMRACAQCTMRDSEDFERVKADLDLYETLLPEGGISRLFTEKTCQLCRGQEKGRRHGYALLDMAHPEPKRLQRWLMGKKTAEIGTMVPLQLGICDACRRRLLIVEYLPLICPIAVGVTGLLLLYSHSCAGAVTGVGSYAPFFSWLAAISLAAIAGNLIAKKLRKKFSADMIVEIDEHPVVAAMIEKGWFPIYKQSRTKLLFSKSRLVKGLGTWDGGATAEAEQPEQPVMHGES